MNVQVTVTVQNPSAGPPFTLQWVATVNGVVVGTGTAPNVHAAFGNAQPVITQAIQALI